MTPTESQMTDFLAPANPLLNVKSTVTLSKTVPKTIEDLLNNGIRAILLDQPELASSERLPIWLALQPNELALSVNKVLDSIYVPELRLYIPARHEMILQLIRKEISASTEPHGAPQHTPVQSNCNGPICRQYRRIARAKTNQMRAARLGYRQHGSVQTKQTKQASPATIPQYAAVEPLITGFTVLQHLYHRPSTPLTSEQKTYMTLKTLPSVIAYLRGLYKTVQ